MTRFKADIQVTSIWKRRLVLGQAPWAAMILVLLCWLVPADSVSGSPQLAVYQNKVKPILKDACIECHNPKKKKGGLDLTTFHGLVKGGLNGSVIEESHSSKSPIYHLLLEGADPHMPPKKQLDDESIAIIKNWVDGLEPGSLQALRGLELAALEQVGQSGDSSGSIASGALKPSDVPDHWNASQVIDYYIEHKLDASGISPAPSADDRSFLRRVFLDLTGVVPDYSELQDFVLDGSLDKRSHLISRLLESDAYATHMSEIFDTVLMGRRGSGWEKRRIDNQWFAYLNDAFSRNRPWTEVVEEIIEARPDPSRPEARGALWFLYERENNYQAMAEAVAPLAFGTQIKCAQCHDHPLAHEIKQSHYWAMVAAFNRSKNVSTKSGIGIAEAAKGGDLEFANLQKQTQKAQLDFFNGIFVKEPTSSNVEAFEKYLVPPPPEKQKPEAPSLPVFSRRAELAKAVADGNSQPLARGMVNRIWAHLMGRGLVHPVDEINSFHPASHPNLLQWLTDQYVENGFDNRWLIQAITASRSYQRARHTNQKANQDPSLFAGALERPVSAESTFRSIIKVTRTSGNKNESQLRAKLIEFFPDLFPVEFNATMQQAMFMSNSPVVQSFVEAGESNLTRQLLAYKSPLDIVRNAFRHILLRDPDSDELEFGVEFLEKRHDRLEYAASYLVWALINNPEFMTNH